MNNSIYDPGIHQLEELNQNQAADILDKRICRLILALFSSKIFCKIDTVVFSFVFDKCCPIMD